MDRRGPEAIGYALMERCGRLYSERLRTIGFQTVCEPSGHLPGFWQPSINMGMATIGFYEPCQKRVMPIDGRHPSRPSQNPGRTTGNAGHSPERRRHQSGRRYFRRALGGGAAVKTYVLKAEIEQDEDGRWGATVPALAGCATWGYTRKKPWKRCEGLPRLKWKTSLKLGK